MLSPNDRPIVLLPQDRELIEILGLTEGEYRQFLRESAKRSRIEPGKPTAFIDFGLVALIFTVIGLLLNVAAQFFKPKSSRPAEIRQSSAQGQNVVNRSEYAPKAGFDSLQNVVELGSTIPVVYANRETIDGITYGGVRVNTNLLWSQMISLGGSQMLRAVFLIAEAPLGEIDPTQFAFGDNLLGAYDLAEASSSSSRVTFYVSLNGGRLRSADRVAGRSAVNDPGNAENAGAGDVFQIPGINNEWTTDFCYTFKPSTQTQFGVYQLIGNGLGFRINPALRPAVIVKSEPAGKTDTRIRCDVDGVAQAQRDKYNTPFSSRSGCTQVNGNAASGTVSLIVGDTVTYMLSSASEANRTFIGVQEGPDHTETCRDVAQTVSGRQRSWDDALSIGELYRFGSALLICETRSPESEIFVSEADQEPIGGGQSITVTLRCVRAGTAVINGTEGTATATQTAHLFKCAIASFALPRAAQVLELGFRSTLGVRISGLCNFRDSLSHGEIDGRACRYYDGRTYRPGQSLELSSYQSGSYSGAEQRYSFFKIGYRIAGSAESFTFLEPCFGTRSLTQQAVFNYVRLQMPSMQRWEFRIEPVSGWEIRSGVATGTLEILDARIAGTRTVASGAVTITYSGEPVARIDDVFTIAATRGKDLGVTYSDGSSAATPAALIQEGLTYRISQPGNTLWGQAGATSSVAGTLFRAAFAVVNSGSFVIGQSYRIVTRERSGAPEILATALVVGRTYRIVFADNSDFMLVGASSNIKGTQFTATGPTTGEGTVIELTNFTIIGASSNTEGTTFVATGVGTATGGGAATQLPSGTGTASQMNDYVDSWGKLAESFVFEELQTSARSPEHELVYVNLLAPNPNTPNYDGMALVGMNLRSSTEFSQLNQLSVYVNQGTKGIHTFPELFYDVLTNDDYGVGAILSPEQVDKDSMDDCAEWTRNRRYFHDSGIASPVNIRQWGSQTASYFLLDFVVRNGKLALQPAVYFGQPEQITNLFTAGNIIDGSFEFLYTDSDQRIPKRVSVKWRQEKAFDTEQNKGLFPVIREVTVREAGTPENAPLETLDLTDFCTSEAHAIDVAKYFCRGSRLFTHSVRFKTTPTQASLQVGRCFKLGLETVIYNQPNNGAIDVNGVITSTEVINDGTYEVLLWDGKTNAIQETTLSISGQKAADHTSAVFCIKEVSSEIRAYKAQSIGYDEDGNVQVEASYFPLDGNDVSLLVDGWDVASNWIIEGAIGTSEESGTVSSPFTGVSLIGPGTLTVGSASTYTALVSGGAGSYSYAWSGSNVTFGSSSAPSTTVSTTTPGAKTLTCTVTRGSLAQSASKTITAVSPSTATTIGTVTLTGNTTTTTNLATVYAATFSGDALPTACFFSWSTSPSTASITGSGTANAAITFEAAGTYTVSCTISSPSASDGPKTQTRTVTVT